MSLSHTIGFPNMLVEKGERRVFLPDFIQWIAKQGLEIFLEEGYGKQLNYSLVDYQQGDTKVLTCSRETAFEKDIVMILRSPEIKEYLLLGNNSVFITMFHFPTRPARVSALDENNHKAISLDSIVNDKNIRLVENMKSVAWNGIETAFNVLEKKWPELNKPNGLSITTLVMGTGMIGKHAVEAATKLGNTRRNNTHINNNGNGALACSMGRNLTNNSVVLKKMFSTTDILVDATQRIDTSKPIIRNEQLCNLPQHAVIVDLSVDPYLLDSKHVVVKGIEGIPQGDLDQYIFAPTDPNWDKTVPKEIISLERRHVVSCYSWPGVYPETCMAHYATQLKPLMKVLLKRGYDKLSPKGEYFEKALYGGTLKAFLSKHITL